MKRLITLKVYVDFPVGYSQAKSGKIRKDDMYLNIIQGKFYNVHDEWIGNTITKDSYVLRKIQKTHKKGSK